MTSAEYNERAVGRRIPTKRRPNADRSLTTLRLQGGKVAATIYLQKGGMKSLQTIGVIGAGTMGTGIAQVCTLAGLSISMLDVDKQRVAHGHDAVAGGLERLVKKAKLSAAARDAALGRLHGTTDYGALRACDLIIEAATENEALKLQILREVDAVAPPGAILATNTSSVSITKLAAQPGARRSLHRHAFLQPGARDGAGRDRSRIADERRNTNEAEALARKLGKSPIDVKDAPGFVVNRLLCRC